MIAGRYSLDREIGRGGSGAVWLGRDEVLGRQVALKRLGLLPGADGTDLARAEREARLTARLNHPHVVAVFDVVVDEETDSRWLVMEYVDGVNLGQLVQREGRLSPDEAAPLLWQAADALVAAHAEGIVHRDVKPSNIMVDRNRQVRLTDFGIARIEADATLTQTGLVTGSPAYLSPEVAQGGRGDEAADVWSLGTTVFYVLSGRPPYEVGDNVLGTLFRIVNDDPPRLDDAGWMAPLLAGTMVKDPSRRWSMSTVRDFLARPLDSVVPAPTSRLATATKDEDDPDTRTMRPAAAAPSPSAPPTSRPGHRSQQQRRSRRPLLLGLGAVLAIAVALAISVLIGDEPPDPGRTANPAATTPAEPDETPSESPSEQPSPTEEPQPTAAGMETFIRDYVRTVAVDPRAAWQMLTPKFQQDSGGFATYREFWDEATNGRVLSIDANPENLSVSYQVRFDNFDNGPGPTVLDLTFQDGKYFIDGERTEGFVPAG